MSSSILQVVGYKNSGKTTIVTKLINILTNENMRVATIKHDAHGFQFDQPGKDTWKHQQAGASLTMIQSPHQLGFIAEQRAELPLNKLVEFISSIGQYDMMIIEGYKHEAYPKIVIIRDEQDFVLLSLNHIQLVMFWQAQDLERYLEESQLGNYSSFPVLAIQDDNELDVWIRKYWNQVKEGEHDW